MDGWMEKAKWRAGRNAMAIKKKCATHEIAFANV